MSANEIEKFKELLNLPNQASMVGFDEYIDYFLGRRVDKRIAVQELDLMIAALQNYILSLSLYVKQKYMMDQERMQKIQNHITTYYTKQEVANLYRVSVRTITNWILDGLECIEIRGVKRISEEAVKSFVRNNKTKKFNWRSIAR